MNKLEVLSLDAEKKWHKFKTMRGRKLDIEDREHIHVPTCI